ncbi:sigma-70 family RNA polymerase sigma factor [Geomicrobium sp. JCM 19038]|uniref:sigma-70 family RNA polymerase sigma factor n=1 Tax=Geomicrobium sp. JCM 19038 TaxID=1460635 RepID=UPI00045F3279|nr:sigma-70 family RNA polymerase sigma factor [Geomicrobium sp. JCM 19038]GAK09135.1 RNA polymerase sigma factor [Geomicrobium sp. JCM 19038]
MEISEKNVVKQLKKKNEKALQYVIDTYGGLVKHIVYKYLYRYPLEREECINDVFWVVWDKIHTFDTKKNSLKNWIAAVASHKAIDYKRKKLRLLAKESSTNGDEKLIHYDELKKLEITLQEEVEELLNHLPEKDRNLFRSYYLEGEQTRALEKKLGLSSTVIYNRLSRGRKQLRKLFRN